MAQNSVEGLLKVDAPPIFGARYLLPQIAKFSEKHPGIEVSLTLSDPSQDFRSKGCDIFIGFNHMSDEYCASMDLLLFPQVLVASPDYILRRGRPKTPADLTGHNCLLHTQKAPNGLWRFANGESVSIHGSFRSNHGEAIKQATLLGHGVSMFPYYFVENECQDGRLTILMQSTPPAFLQFSAVYDARRVRSTRMQEFLRTLKDWAEGQVPEQPDFSGEKKHGWPTDQDRAIAT